MSATSINSTSVPINSSSSSSSSSNSGSNNVLSSASNIVILENQILDSNDVVAAAGLQQLSNAGTIKLTRDCAVQYSNLINSYGSANSSSGSSSNNGSIVTNSNTINIIPGDASQTSSRVQVLSNVQLVSKGGSQPSTFSYVDASGKNFNVLTSSGKISTNKLISVPITKVKTFNHIGQQPQQQSPQTQIVSSQMQQPQHPVQKVSVPRSIQLVTRIPSSTISVSNGRVSQIAPAIAPPQQQQPSQFSIQQFTDSGAGISSSSLDMKNTAQGPTTTTTTSAIPSIISNKNVTVKGKAATGASLKVLQNATITPAPKTSAVGKGMSVSLKSVRNNSKTALSGINSQYFVKNSTNGTVQQQQQPSGTTTSIYTTSPAQAVYHNPTPHPPQQPMQIPIGTAPAPSGKGASSTVGTFDSSSSAGHSAHEHPVPSVTVTGYTSSAGKGKKYGSIASSESGVPQTYAASAAVKVKNAARGRNNSLSASYQPLESGSYQRYSASPSRQQQQFPSSPQQQQQSHHAAATSGRDEHLFINGQQMTDETSARILQSLSQKSQTESNSSTTGKYSNYKPQQQFTFYGSDSVPQLSQNNVPAAFLPGGIGTNTSGSSSNSTSSTAPLGVVYDPSDARFYEDKPDGRRTSTSEIITYSSENIPLREGYPAHYNYNYREDDDQIGVEVRPAPVDTSNGRFHVLQAVMQDHTYFAVLPELKPPELPPVSHPTASPHNQQHQQQQYVALSLSQHTMQSKHKSSSPAPAVIVTSASTTASSPASALAPPVPASSSTAPVSGSASLTQMSLNNLDTITSSSGSSSGVPVSVSTAPAVVIPTVATSQPVSSTLSGSSAGLDYIYQPRPQDDDANSVISTGSRNFNNMDNDLGEETETAPEGEGEDDSVTRCICDLTHDDGYMICCDKCSAWQHVDCMGIDRLNIPDEYNCEMCQPRLVDKNRARLLQMEKRKEQSLFLSNNNLQQMQLTDTDVSSTNLINVPTAAVGTAVVSSTGSGKGANQYTTGKAVAGSKKGKASSSSKKKVTDGSASTKKTNKKTAENSLNRVNGKRKELKKPSKKKVKTVEQNAEKMSNMIRTWIDNYERAITNHYSPELRARLQAFGKMQSHNPLLNVDRLIPATAVSNLMQKCTTVPHAGGKILISTGDIEPKTPIIEIRGKYMISSQHKQLQSLFNMAANGKLGNNKNAGPFLFLYQLTNGGMELCVDTRTYGNDARFVRRSCRPNAEILHNVDKGVVHLYIVSTVNIKANTEITIKHDEQLIQRVGGVVILTHTTVTNICACGLIKECQYSAQLSEGLFPTTSGIPAVPAGPVSALPANAIAMPPISAQGVSSTVNTATNASKPSKNKKNNGALGESTEKKPAKKRNSRSTSANAESRLRSISSSGDSTNEMMLYFQQQQPNAQSAPWNQQLSHQSRQQHPIGAAAIGSLNLTMPPQQQQQQQMALGPLPPHDSSPLPCNEEMSLSTSGQLLQHHLHQWQQQQQHPNLSNLVHGHPPQNQHQAAHLPPPPLHPPQTPPPMSPVMGLNNRPGFYTEIKSPINSPPLCFIGGPPPSLAVPTVHSPVKSIPQLQSPPSKVVTKPAPTVTHRPVNDGSPSIPDHGLAEEQTRMELIQQQQQLHQQQIMEDILKIKIKSPAASPVKQEPPALSPTASTSSMLSPPPPPPIPIAQRLLCAETLKNELFHSHFTQQQSQRESSPPATQTAVLPPATSPHHLQPTLLKSPVKVEYSPHSSPGKEIKQEVHSESVSVNPELLKTEPEIKTEPIQVVAPPVLPVEDFTKVMKEELPEPSRRASRPCTPVQVEEVKKEDPLLCDSTPDSPVKNHTSSPVAGCNSSNSSPHIILHQQGNSSSSKKKTGASRDNSVSHSTVAPVKEEKKPSRKLTREERKMEAIVKAFEKMEQSQQRKQELKEQRKEGKRRSVSSSTPDESVPSGSNSTKKRSLSSSQKRKKKKSKSLSQHFGSPTQSRKKKLSKSSKSSKKSSPVHHAGSRSYENKAAELLLTFSQSTEKPTQSLYFGDDVKSLDPSEPRETLNSTNSPSTMSSNLPLLSSACMLVEAAVAPLEQQQQSSSATPGPQEQDFKFPHKAKTKKSMSREWLSGQVDVPFRRVTPDQDSGYMSEEKPHDFRRTNTEGLLTPLGVDVTEAATNNICIAAKKVEEFIAQNSPQSDEISTSGGGGGGAPAKWDDKSASSGSSTSLGVASASESNQTQTSCIPESAAAKKRWLRQAISEETDEQNQASSSPPPPNGFTTPLKKRRVIRTPEDAPSQQHHSNHLDLLAQQQQQPPQVLAAAQKIDFGGQPMQQQQLMTVLTQSGYPVDRSNPSYWNNAGPAPLPYGSPAIVAEEKHAIDLSRTAPVAHRLPPPRIAPYKIVPIAQALTPLHFTDDPEPLPVVIPPSATAPVVSHEQQQHHHMLDPLSESIDFSRQISSASEIPQRMCYESPCHAPLPASAVAAVVPASLMPPEPQQLYPAVRYHPPEGDDTATTLRNSLAPPRSKGSQKYIGSPAKFEPVLSLTESQNSSVAAAETPEKNSSVVSCSDVDEEDAVLSTASTAAVEQLPQPLEPVHEMTPVSGPSSSDSVATKAIDDKVGVTHVITPELIQQEQQETVLQEEEIVNNEVVVEQVAQEPMDINESPTMATGEEDRSTAQKVGSGEPTTMTEQSRPPVKSDAVNGREKSKKTAPREECENNELEDLQKVIASFHSENIMTLISRNKKAKKGGRDSDDKPSRSGSRKHSRNKQNASAAKAAEVVPRVVADKVQQSPAELPGPTVTEAELSETTNIAVLPSVESTVDPTTTTLTSHMPSEEIPSVSTLGRSYSHPSWSSTTADTLRVATSEARMRPDIPQISYNSPSTYQSNAARNLLSSLSVGSEPLSTLGAYRPSTSSFLDYPKATSGAAVTTTSSGNTTTSSIYQYRPSTEISSLLEKGFTSGARPSSFLDDRSRTDRVIGISTERIVSSSSFLLSASKAATDNLSTLGSTGSSYPKIFTKTASHDPRLNPALTTPEPAAPITPKRKLSINEYRQRKMQSSSSVPSTTASASSSSEVASSSSRSSSVVIGSIDNNAISSSLGSNDVSSSISKELSLELEMELNESSEVEADLVAATVIESSGSRALDGSSGSAANIGAEPSCSEQAV